MMDIPRANIERRVSINNMEEALKGFSYIYLGFWQFIAPIIYHFPVPFLFSKRSCLVIERHHATLFSLQRGLRQHLISLDPLLSSFRKSSTPSCLSSYFYLLCLDFLAICWSYLLYKGAPNHLAAIFYHI